MSINVSNAKVRLWSAAPSIVVIALTVLAFWVRIRNWPMVMTAGGVRFLGNDTLYHMRRVFLAVRGGLQIPDLDLYLNFPAGLHPNWPPLYDQFMAAIALMLGGGQPGPALVERVGALTPPVLGALTVPVLYRAACRLMPRPAAMAAAASAAVLPYAIQVSVLGRPDHHVAALLGACLVLWTVMRAFEARTVRQAVRDGALAGLCLYLCMGVWTGSLLLAFVLAAAFGLALLIDNPDHGGRLAAGGAALFGTTALLFAPLGLTSYAARTGTLAWEAPSPFHVFLFGALALGIPAWRLLLSGGMPGPVRARGRSLGGGLLLLAVIAWGVWRIDAPALLAEGAAWVQKRDPLLDRLVESMPLTWSAAGENFTRLVVLMPALLGWIVVEQTRRRRPTVAVLVLVWCVVLAAAAWRQERFSDLFSIAAAILLGKAVEVAVRLVRRVWHRPAPDGLVRRPVRGLLAALLLAAGFAYAAAPTARWLRGYWHSAPRLADHAVHDLCAWLRDHTPDPGGYEDGARPAYAVLADWPYGHAITYIGRRPNVANPFVGWKENREANLAPYRFYISDDPAAAAGLLRAYGVRYVVVTEALSSGHIADMLQALDLPHDTCFQATPGANGPIYSPNARLMRSMGMRLFLGDGAGLDDFRLVHASPSLVPAGDRERPLFKVYEYTAPASDEP